MNVADIEGASPSVAPEKVKNINRGKGYFDSEKANSQRMDALGHY